MQLMQKYLPNKTTIISKLAADYLNVEPVLGHGTINNLLMMPFSFFGQIHGVIEFGFFLVDKDPTHLS